MTEDELIEHIGDLTSRAETAAHAGQKREAAQLLEHMLVVIKTYDLDMPVTVYEVGETVRFLRSTA